MQKRRPRRLFSAVQRTAHQTADTRRTIGARFVGRGRNVKKTCLCRHVKKICRWHIFSVDLSGYAAVASIPVYTAPSFSSDHGGYAAASILSLKVPPHPAACRTPRTPSIEGGVSDAPHDNAPHSCKAGTPSPSIGTSHPARSTDSTPNHRTAPCGHAALQNTPGTPP